MENKITGRKSQWDCHQDKTDSEICLGVAQGYPKLYGTSYEHKVLLWCAMYQLL
jgi:hypothetical protein